MRCVVCRNGETRPGRVSAVLERGSTTVIFGDVPAEVCENCGEEYLSEETTARLMVLAEDAVRSGVQVEIREYAAA